MSDPLVEANTSAALALAIWVKHDVRNGVLVLPKDTQIKLDDFIQSERDLDVAIEEARERNKAS